MIVPIDLSRPNQFHDIPDIPQQFHKTFKLSLPDAHEVDPAWVVSDAIINMGIWEPWETMFLSSAFARAEPLTLFLDLGAHCGWFSALAASHGLGWIAVENDRRMVRHLRWLQKHTEDGSVSHQFIDQNWGLKLLWGGSALIVKMDLEGNEEHAVRGMWEYFVDGTITHCLMEISPVFNDSYPTLCASLIGLGYEAWVMPEKKLNPPPIEGRFYDHISKRSRPLHKINFDEMATWLEKQHQIDVMFSRPEAKWG